MQPRATWKGTLNVSLVSLSVKAYSSSNSQAEAVTLHQLHEGCGARIRYQKVCPQHGPVPGDEIVMGYEHTPTQHVVIDLEQLDQLRNQHQLRAIRIDSFVEAGTIGALYDAGKHYYLLPDGPTAQLPYALLVQAMRARGAEAVAQVVLSRREQLVLVRPQGDLLLMTVLKYAAQVRRPEKFAQQLSAAPAISAEQRELAETLIGQHTTSKFDLSQYQDPYAEKLVQLVEAQLEGQALIAPPESEPPAVLNLIQALRQSVAQTTNSRTPTKGNDRQRKKPAPKTSSRRRARKKSA
jgi:DNA end-binding protein Ku